MNINGQGVTSLITDHNGFYYFETSGSGRTYAFNFYYKCKIAQFTTAQNKSQGMLQQNFWIDETFFPTFPYADFLATPCNRILIEGQAFLTDKNIGIPGATIVLSRGATTTTDDNGNFTLIAHDEVGVPQRNDILIFANGVCNYTGIDGVCVAVKNITIIPCASCSLRVLQVGQYLLEYEVLRGLLSGGVYGGGVTGWGLAEKSDLRSANRLLKHSFCHSITSHRAMYYSGEHKSGYRFPRRNDGTNFLAYRRNNPGSL